MKVDLERFKKLRTGTPHYQGCLDSILRELAAAREVVEDSRHAAQYCDYVSAGEDLAKSLKKYDEACGADG